ncbi:MAG: hypothetical protein A2284_10305 [Deltaproteobacteria bacterium RIFOXYA12_FULL_61_11]|nr:MAG: hypothetical protein A2284_10305 [Deltaproteobacteria bacterium RIFOXYA12_FULL_61_11]
MAKTTKILILCWCWVLGCGAGRSTPPQVPPPAPAPSPPAETSVHQPTSTLPPSESRQLTYKFTLEQLERTEALEQRLSELERRSTSLGEQDFGREFADLEKSFAELGYHHGTLRLLLFGIDYRRQRNSPEKALELAERAIGVCDSIGDSAGRKALMFNVALLLEQLGRFELAALKYEELLAAVELPSELRATALLNLGVLRQRANAGELARTCFHRAAILAPEHGEIQRKALWNLLTLHYGQRQDVKALTVARTLLEHTLPSEERARVLLLCAVLEERLGNIENALATTGQALLEHMSEQDKNAAEVYQRYLQKKREYQQKR